MSTTEEVEKSLAIQTKRHEVLKTIIELIAELRKTDDDGAEWVVEQVGEG